MKLRLKKITMDGKELTVKLAHKTIVDVARANGIGIPAPCYLQGRVHGCCNGCVVLIDDEEQYACTIKPREGMVVITNTPELKELRKERLLLFKRAIETGEKLECNCGDGCGDDDCGCEGGC